MGDYYLTVQHFEDLINIPYVGQKNAVCWQRKLIGNFEELALQLELENDITEISLAQLANLNLSTSGNLAKETIINDYKLLKSYGAQPSINLIKAYQKDQTLNFISTDVYSYHVDRSPVPTHTFLCTYYGTSSDFIANDHAIQKIKIPEIREQILALYDGDINKFDAFLKEEFFDLHYQPLPHAIPINLGNGNLWRLAVDHPTQSVLPCIHRAPEENGRLRLMLIC